VNRSAGSYLSTSTCQLCTTDNANEKLGAARFHHRHTSCLAFFGPRIIINRPFFVCCCTNHRHCCCCTNRTGRFVYILHSCGRNPVRLASVPASPWYTVGAVGDCVCGDTPVWYYLLSQESPYLSIDKYICPTKCHCHVGPTLWVCCNLMTVSPKKPLGQ
jgi:hypothetical protein